MLPVKSRFDSPLLLVIVSLVLLFILSTGCTQRELREGEQREYYAKAAPACQIARDRNGRMIPGTYVCDPRRAPVVGSRIVRNKKPTPRSN